jgi:hypothetical protein
MAAGPKFKFANYDGGLPSHATPEKGGTLVLAPNGRWALHYAASLGEGDRWIYGAIRRYPFTVTETSPTSCHVTMSDSQDAAITASFDLPTTPAKHLEEALEAQARSEAAIAARLRKISSEKAR